MPIVGAVDFENSHRRLTRVTLLHPDRPASRNFETTLITGQNGSQKSTLLKQLVTSLVSPAQPDLFSDAAAKVLNPDKHQVLCLSGSAADRFPPRELPQGKRSIFDVPYYTYVGQRVGNNLLSRKSPLETMLSFALQPRAVERSRWDFFDEAHRHAGVFPSARYTLAYRTNSKSDTRPFLANLRESLSNITPETDDTKHRGRPFPAAVSYATARRLLDEFTAAEFEGLARLLNRQVRFDVILSNRGATCETANAHVLRLGLLLGLLRLQEVEVRSKLYETEFSAFELSSGEYAMFSTILAIGFGLDEQSVLLMDEPENSLHPQWQRDLMSTVFGACSKIMRGGHVIICTHSPLIVGSALQGSTIVDMTLDAPQINVVAYGASADELLLNQFGVASSRNKIVVDRVQFAVSLIERGDFDNAQFQQLIPELRTIRDALSDGDPLIDVINALVDEQEAL